MLLAGGRNWDASARAALHEFAARWHLPVAASWRYQDVFDHTDPHYIGDVGIGINPHRQGIHVSAQQNCRTRLGAMQCCHDTAGVFRQPDIEIQALQGIQDSLLCPWQVQAKFRMLVNLAPEGHGTVLQRLRLR